MFNFNLLGVQSFLILSTLSIFHFLTLKETAIFLGFTDAWFGFKERPVWLVLLVIALVNFLIFFKSKKIEVFSSMIGNVISLFFVASFYFLFIKNISMSVLMAFIYVSGSIVFTLSFFGYFRNKKVMASVFLFLQPVLTAFSFWLYFAFI